MSRKETSRKEKVDYEALRSNLMRIPRLKVEIARYLLNIGIGEVYQLHGRSPEVLFEHIRKKTPEVPADVLHWIRMAVYYAEADPPDRTLLRPEAWKD